MCGVKKIFRIEKKNKISFKSKQVFSMYKVNRKTYLKMCVFCLIKIL